MKPDLPSRNNSQLPLGHFNSSFPRKLTPLTALFFSYFHVSLQGPGVGASIAQTALARSPLDT